MDPLDLADPIRLVILALPERYRAPAAVLISTLAATQLIAASIIARLPLSAREHPRYGRVVRALHWYSVLRLRDEKGTVKPIGGDVAPRVTPAPTRTDEVALSRETIAPPAPIAPLRGTTLTGREGERGSASVRSLLAVVVTLTVVLPLGVALAGCPRMPPVSGCQPQAQTCINDSPHVCSASQRWHRAGSLTCSQVGGSCAVVGGRAFCAAPVVDAGAADAADGDL